MLSEENRKKLNMYGLYRHKPDVKIAGKLYEDNLWHCHNWTYRLSSSKDGQLYFNDTYFSKAILVTDENIDEFEFILDQREFDDLGSRSKDCVMLYDEKDWFRLPVDSGGISFPHYFLRKGAKQSFSRLMQAKQAEISRCESTIRWLQDDIDRLKQSYEDNPERFAP